MDAVAASRITLTFLPCYCRYFAAVTASTRLFTSKPGLAIAGPLTLFSLSSLFLTSFGTRFFTDVETGDLDASAFLSFLGWFLGAANFVSAVFMRPPPVQDQRPLLVVAEAGEADERTALLQDGRLEESHEGGTAPTVVLLPGVPWSQSIFWALGFLMVVGVGASEMVMSSVGNMVVSLLGTSQKSIDDGVPISLGMMATALVGPAAGIGPVALRIRAEQVKLLAIANTIARLTGGLMSDLVAPSSKDAEAGSTRETQGLLSDLTHRLTRIRISRVTILLMAILIGLVAYAWAAFGITSTQGLPTFSLMVGISYGLIFSLVPAITCTA